ncbi:hypothetical protein [Candidatus Pelagisphaera phototrophica]|uniref:hypothetical protein n=1 Tax=Candidatus Pelagisphaera phototrophica TaxID=2684113 RepID=UPI0019E17011|nr:hypothetical protein [Candidatus Pelagisphaera phototrophica]QXD32530.1 hypothetical protein GA004_02055 [Candidatus Pelagisphaera phototrophica]
MLSHTIDTTEFEFLDFGCSSGGSLKLYGKTFNAEGKGLGLDIDPNKVEQTIKSGFNAKVCDITNIDISSKVRFTIMHHFSEHIPSIFDFTKIVQQAVKVSREFVIIRQPFFDADPYLFQNGFKFYWSNWKGHPNHMTMLEFTNLLNPLCLKGKISSFSIYGIGPVRSSDSNLIHNIDSPVDQHHWSHKKHSKKLSLMFDQPVYAETFVLIDIDGESTKAVSDTFNLDKRFYKSY